eukprot:scaffold407_cov168-Amphora_coffeaeformis.AAC.1
MNATMSRGHNVRRRRPDTQEVYVKGSYILEYGTIHSKQAERIQFGWKSKRGQAIPTYMNPGGDFPSSNRKQGDRISTN